VTTLTTLTTLTLAPPGEVAQLVAASAQGDPRAWAELVRRYAHLVLRVTRQFRLAEADAQDVSQTVWLRLVEHLHTLRDPQALAGWLATTARNECLRQLRHRGRTIPVDPQSGGTLDRCVDRDPQDDLLAAERLQVLRDGVAELTEQQRALLALLAADPPLTYAQISELLGMPIGSIGPTRSRCLERLRRSGAVRNYLEADRRPAAVEGGGRHAHAEVE
jgi:RNA polymerase sigma factor (sigma-70 family)